MSGSNRKATLSGPGQTGQLAPRSSRSASNPPVTNSPPRKRGSRSGGSSTIPQVEEELDRTLQTAEGSPSPSREGNQLPDPTVPSSISESAPVEAIRGIIDRSRKGKERETHLFAHAPHLKMAPAYEETLTQSIVCCHHTWDPAEDIDPLWEFGAEEGVLQGLTPTQTMPFRDILICWTAPHQNLEWENLEDYTQLLCATTLSRRDIELIPENGKSYYTLHYKILMHTYEVTLGITQIISTIDRLLARSARRSFSIDKGFVILKQLAMGEDADHIQLSFYTLQIRCKGAVNHIRQDLNSIRAIFGQFNNALTNRSYNSTLSDIRSNYGQLPPRLEVARHMLREDYQKEMPEHLRSYKDKLVEEWVKSGREINARPYERKPAHYPQLKYDERSDSPRAWSRMQGSLPTLAPSQPLVFGSVSSRDRRRAPPPTSISMAVSRNHPLSHFAGLNSNMGGEEGREGEDSDPHNPWITVQSGRFRSTRSRPTHVNKNARFASPHEDQPSTPAIHTTESFSYTKQGRSGRSLNGGGPPNGDSPPGGGSPSGPRYPARRNNEGLPLSRGHAQNSGQGPPGGEPPGGDPGYGIDPEEKGPEDEKNKGEWQLNNKISMGMIPQWDGNPTTMIDYIMEIALLARLSKRLFKEIGQIAPIRWTGSAKGWWMTLPRADQAYFSQDWECLMTGMCDHFMNDEWLNDRGIEFDAMRFRDGWYTLL
ncbi:uncharacterized protein LACBIDRAFT_335110 [Laccaria bicolor S238N-H82]|uniref:Predicted protein n=1 Tax=Laccaria bicolor (strain S238N-H82 / ATCC MYA-4686) TaxID=486041 RepID=B0E1E2_LACBS|nr:uncharacterized protein LACBIDRAFT_335110 [Laccaria bicolor S238N-H82]EDQ99366.1 predicted protein [Laccaria bicolor S238N-H82]|eukprot:XP_001890012.1 predicted protein [Laccaria bicolor S238N-H82]